MARTRTLVQLTDNVVAALDPRSVATGRSRTDLIREVIEYYLREATPDDLDLRIVDGYRRIPQDSDPWAEALARESIAAEQW